MKQFVTGERLGSQRLAELIQPGMGYLHHFKHSL